LNKDFTSADGKTVSVLKNLSLTTKEGDFICILGASGSGKTTLLNIISGLESYTGKLGFREQDKPVSRSDVRLGRVFQEHRLLPWATIFENIQLVLQGRAADKEFTNEKIRKYLELVDLWDVKHYYPSQLSGGMQQRVALARAFAIEPGLLLMDEPFNSLDNSLAKRLSADLLRLWENSGKTIIFVTHSILEALFLSDKLLVLDKNTGAFSNEWDNPLPRPRDYRSPELYQLYLKLMTEMDSAL
jgi:NitT/TauT family transport system ATP-binding protein